MGFFCEDKLQLNSYSSNAMPGHLIFPGVPEGQEDKNLLKSSVPGGPEVVKVPVRVWLAAESAPDDCTSLQGQSYSRTLVRCQNYRKDRI